MSSSSGTEDLVEYEELMGSPQIKLSRSAGQSVERQFLVKWDDALKFADQIAGVEYPGLKCKVDDVDIKPLTNIPPDSGSGAGETDFRTTINTYLQEQGKRVALVIVKYGMATVDVDWPSQLEKPDHDEGTILLCKVKSSGRFMTIPTTAIAWEDNPTREPSGPIPPPEMMGRKFIATNEYHITWDLVDVPPLDRWDELKGHINGYDYMGKDGGCLLFDGYDCEPSFRITGGTLVGTVPFTFKLTCVLRHQLIVDPANAPGPTRLGWNYEYRTMPTPGWSRIVLPSVTAESVGFEPPYPEADFSGMFNQVLADPGA